MRRRRPEHAFLCHLLILVSLSICHHTPIHSPSRAMHVLSRSPFHLMRTFCFSGR